MAQPEFMSKLSRVQIAKENIKSALINKRTNTWRQYRKLCNKYS